MVAVVLLLLLLLLEEEGHTVAAAAAALWVGFETGPEETSQLMTTENHSMSQRRR